ncbi:MULTISPECIES: FKBP-type peptidyl-prolyl cis-trans isomerase [Streptosporangium]|uniref:Peptidyl-prolyl cis-trans isomerase n=1 Tax=Streptosporangium brasiliense TaxID=47480 RepID=A0ABT9RF96_9ACTN|nr:FKBP-type peptidyl-prolyl cis-trans isomerase [Streptosporangium brasiliense]MDP9867516.1 peptidylprolyl isomerase [Streptosporangium brasiliense]
MRTPPLLAALSLVLAAACTSAGGRPGPDIEVLGDFGVRPKVVFPEGEPAGDLRIREQMAGTGNVIKGGDLVVAHYTAHVWDGADNRLLASSFNQGAPASFPLGRSISGVGKALQGRRVGSRVVAAIPPGEGYGPNPPGGMTADDELFYVVDVLGAFSPDAAARGRGGPGALAGVEIGGGSGERPAVSLPDARPPAELRSKVLIRGDGPRIQAGQLLVTQYECRVWGTGAAESTWGDGQPKAVRIGDGSVIPGWDKALVGVPVGSRVAMVVPPALGYRDGLPPLVKPSDTLVFVVDVLAAY